MKCSAVEESKKEREREGRAKAMAKQKKMRSVQLSGYNHFLSANQRIKNTLYSNTKTPQNALVKWQMKHTNCEISASAFSMGLKLEKKLFKIKKRKKNRRSNEKK